MSNCRRRVCIQKSKQHAPKGQKLIAQGNTLGKSIANHNAPCKGKSVNYQCFCPCRAFCYFQSVHPRRCLGLCAFGAFSPLCLTFDTSAAPSFFVSFLVAAEARDLRYLSYICIPNRSKLRVERTKKSLARNSRVLRVQ